MEIKKTDFKDLLEIKFKKHKDSRGSLIKIFNRSNSTKFKNQCYESYLSISKKGSIRGLHGQSGKYAQDKLVYCIRGELLEIALDIRKSSKTYGKIYKKKINSKNAISVFVPKGFLHGIVALEDQTTLVTYCSKPYNPTKEYGIRIDSININLPKIKLYSSKKDKKLPTLNEFLKKIK